MSTPDASETLPHDAAGAPPTDGPDSSTVDGLTRHRSIQFNVTGSEARLGERSISSRKSSLRRIPSPPPPSSYNRGVSFDTFDNRDATDFSLTLNYKHKDYRNTRRSRTFLCGTDQNDYSDFALEWLIDELVDDGDEIVCLRVVEKDSKIASDTSVEEGRYRQEAEKILDQVITKNRHEEKAISLILELAVGKVQEIIQRMIQIYEPAVLIVGTRGRSLGGMQGLLPGSVSKYCLQQSPIPVIVVRSSTKREKKKQKRLADPSRKSYNHILKMSEARGGRLFTGSASANSSTSKLPESEEAAAVAKAIGLSSTNVSSEYHDYHEERNRRSSLLSKDSSVDNDDDSIGHGSSSTAPNSETPSPGFSTVVLKSPSLGRLESPSSSDEDEEADGDENTEVDEINNNSQVPSTNPNTDSPAENLHGGGGLSQLPHDDGGNDANVTTDCGRL
ncbi:hypothetical protein FQN57_007077 [Myotisia sp. PD_48]|nr:hypothetical protein FQN57_007077 [Myotisia sp. PD_48]